MRFVCSLSGSISPQIACFRVSQCYIAKFFLGNTNIRIMIPRRTIQYVIGLKLEYTNYKKYDTEIVNDRLNPWS